MAAFLFECRGGELIQQPAHPRQQFSELVLEGQEIQHGRQWRRY
jgi:hypothetical protein